MRGESHIQDVPATELAALVKDGFFEATTDEKTLARGRRDLDRRADAAQQDARSGHELRHRRG